MIQVKGRLAGLVVVLLLVGGCGSDDGAPDYDAAAVTDLRVALTSAVGATLRWTAPEIEGGAAQYYEVRALPGATGAFAWEEGIAVAGEPTPNAPSSTETCRATGLASGTEYRVAMRFGADGWWSPVSNVVTFTTVAAPPIPSGFVYVPAGVFTSGSPASEMGRDDDETRHEVTLTRACFLAEYEVTQARWTEMMGVNPGDTACASCPVTGISFTDALDFCNRLSVRDGLQPCYDDGAWNRAADGYRLPTEAEWEYACRAGTTTAFCSGALDSLDCSYAIYLDEVGHYCHDSDGIASVGGKLANDWGLYDMHGNVWEWCWDWYARYPTGQATDPSGPVSGHLRVMRGGGWNSTSQQCRAASRSAVLPSWRTASIGLRLARDAD
jgi:formylglycine-generating enzyme required for sulfatase activity